MPRGENLIIVVMSAMMMSAPMVVSMTMSVAVITIAAGITVSIGIIRIGIASGQRYERHPGNLKDGNSDRLAFHLNLLHIDC